MLDDGELWLLGLELCLVEAGAGGVRAHACASAIRSRRDADALHPLLFEHVVDLGLGILACRHRPGKSYEVMPVHWPRRLTPDPMEKEQFLERYRRSFEAARVLAPRGRTRYPKL